MTTSGSKILSSFASTIDRFKKQHSPVEQFVVVIGSILTPVYFIQNKVAALLFAIQSVANGEGVNFVGLFILCIQTILVFYNLGLLINFFFSPESNVTNVNKGKYEGVHPALEFTVVPRYLIAPEIEPKEDTVILEDTISANIRTIEEVLGEDVLPKEFDSAEDIIAYYTKLYGEEDAAIKNETMSMADKLRSSGVDIDKLLED